MKAGNLTSRTSDVVKAYRYAGPYALHADGAISSVLTVSQRRSGNACLTLHYEGNKMWSIELTDEQRIHLAKWLGEYQPVLFEEVKDSK